MRSLVVSVFLAILAVAGCAEQMVQEDAKSACAKQGKRAFILSAHEKGIPLLIDSATAQYFCVPPQNVVQLQSPFGADVVDRSEFNGVGILAVLPGMGADKAGIKAGDVLYEVGSVSVLNSTELRSAIDASTSRTPIAVKLRRNDKDITVTVQF